MNTEQFTYFIEAAECLNFSSVAKLHYVTPPVITRQIKLLEDEIGVELFTRNGHKLMLTEEGKVFLKYAKRTYSLMSEGIHHAQKLKEERLGTLHIAGVASSARDSQKCIALLREHLGNFPTNMVVGNAETMAESMRKGAADLIFADEHIVEDNDDYSYIITGETRFCLIVPQEFQVDEWPSDMSVFKDVPFELISFVGAPFLNKTVLDIFARYSFMPFNIDYYNRMEDVVIGVKNGKGISIIQENMFDFISDDGIKCIAVPDDIDGINTVFAWRKKLSNELAEKSVNIILDHFGRGREIFNP